MPLVREIVLSFYQTHVKKTKLREHLIKDEGKKRYRSMHLIGFLSLNALVTWQQLNEVARIMCWLIITSVMNVPSLHCETGLKGQFSPQL